MKTVLSVLLCLVLVVVFSGNAMAAGNWRKGKKVYRKECMSCHKRGGEAKRLKLNRRTKNAWAKFCKTNDDKHAPVWSKLTEKQKKDLLKYLQKYAKDDKQILGCG